MQEINLNNITIDKLSLPFLIEKSLEADVLRLDKIHPVISGNKWFKLRYYLEEAKVQDKKTIVTYGGAWSNHILATAAACKLNSLNSIGIIRGEEATTLSPTLIKAKELGMKVMVGCMNESSIGTAAIAQLAPMLDYVDMDGPLLLAEDTATGVGFEFGKISYTDIAGLGIKAEPF